MKYFLLVICFWFVGCGGSTPIIHTITEVDTLYVTRIDTVEGSPVVLASVDTVTIVKYYPDKRKFEVKYQYPLKFNAIEKELSISIKKLDSIVQLLKPKSNIKTVWDDIKNVALGLGIGILLVVIIILLIKKT